MSLLVLSSVILYSKIAISCLIFLTRAESRVRRYLITLSHHTSSYYVISKQGLDNDYEQKQILAFHMAQWNFTLYQRYSVAYL